MITTNREVYTEIEKQIHTAQAELLLRQNEAEEFAHNPFQLRLLFEPAGLLPLSAFPINPWEFLRVFDGNAAIYREGRLLHQSNPILARSTWGPNHRGLERFLVLVNSEFVDDFDFPEPIARFAELREIARLLYFRELGVHPSAVMEPGACTLMVSSGDFIGRGFFDDSLNRLALESACPVRELRNLLGTTWGPVPVTEKSVIARDPSLAFEDPIERFLAEKVHEDKNLQELFGVSLAAILGWCRYNELVTI